jgi:murein DD-endopeptidase MepM/ murein hydrolase activator NlpD
MKRFLKGLHHTSCRALPIVVTGLLALTGLAQAADYAYAPVAGTMTSPFGWRSDPINGGSRFHGGIDIAAPSGSPVYTPQEGVVVYSGNYGGYGNVVVIHHGGGLYTLYGHNSYLMVNYGDRVSRGQVVALVGSTGRSTGPHLHFEVRQGNGYVNPLDYLGYLHQSGGYALAGTVQPVTTSPSRVSSAHYHSTARPNRGSHQRPRRKPNWSVEVIKGDNVEVVEF